MSEHLVGQNVERLTRVFVGDLQGNRYIHCFLVTGSNIANNQRIFDDLLLHALRITGDESALLFLEPPLVKHGSQEPCGGLIDDIHVLPSDLNCHLFCEPLRVKLDRFLCITSFSLQPALLLSGHQALLALVNC